MKNRARRTICLAACLAAAATAIAGTLLATHGASGASATIPASKDNTLYEESGDTSNGAGAHLFTGRTAFGASRRTVIAFDIAAHIPAGSTVTRAALTLFVSRSEASAEAVSLHRLLVDWGEAGSDAGEPGGTGTTAQPGDATWIYTFYPVDLWSLPGGDFSATVSGSTPVGSIGFYTWGSTPGMVADVQSWLDTPGSSYGWIVIGDETHNRNAIRFDSRENLTPSNRPVLEVEFDPPASAAGSVPNGADVPGPELTVQKLPGGSLHLEWAVSCKPGDTDYEVYEGILGSFASHAPRVCSTAGATMATVSPGAGGRYYLAVPRNASVEGSYGKNSSNVERPQGASSCLPQAVTTCP